MSKTRRRELCIDTIQNLYPPDADDEGTGTVGQRIVSSIACRRWRELPTEVLEEIAGAMTARDHIEPVGLAEPF